MRVTVVTFTQSSQAQIRDGDAESRNTSDISFFNKGGTARDAALHLSKPSTHINVCVLGFFCADHDQEKLLSGQSLTG
jgi:hypothetical protein